MQTASLFVSKDGRFGARTGSKRQSPVSDETTPPEDPDMDPIPSEDGIDPVSIETELKLRKEFSLELSRKALAFDLLKTEHDALRKIHVDTLKIKEQQIADLNELVRKQASSDHSEWWLAGGVTIGIALSIAVFYASVEVAK